ncbi:DMT family transporter [Kineosporia sp. J2-2]|uniref:DMT family transporter n=1 Tax=Kineosporia corallincola TaxID=2835133 RepID=A0ABS5TGP7_9ACTN|nr:DMT family transporter [Kineosporia corallincola]MBT0768774.1 DMT family transporter [Kineosporia corallincola]
MTARAVVPRSVGITALLVAMAAWAGFALSTRAIGTSHLSVPEVCAVRYLTPTVLLAPWWPRAWREVRAADPLACALIAAGGGAPFFVLTALGAKLSSAGHISIVNLGAAPVLLGLFARDPARLLRPGLAVITVGIALLAIGTPGGGAGVAVLLLSATLWTLYTTAQARVSLSPLTVVLLMSAPSTVLSAPALIGLDAPGGEIALFVAAQGIGSGIVSAVAYAVAIRVLGVPATTLASALTPVLVAVLSALLFGEVLTVIACAGLVLVSTGVAVQGLGRAPA